MGSIGVPELIIIFVVALIVFGPKKLPELGKSLGKGIAEFRKASTELRSTFEQGVSSIESDPPALAHREEGTKATQKSQDSAHVD